MWKKYFLLFLLFIVANCFAYDQSDDHYQTMHPLSIGGQIFLYNHERPIESSAIDYIFGELTGINHIGGGINVGYRFNDFLGIEGGYQYFISEQSSGNSLLGPDHYRLSGLTVMGKLFCPLGKRVDLFADLGAMIVHEDTYNLRFAHDKKPAIDSNYNQLQPLIGAGISIYLCSYFSIDLSIVHTFASSNIRGITYIPLSLTFHLM
jgi:hypothetical protein